MRVLMLIMIDLSFNVMTSSNAVTPPKIDIKHNAPESLIKRGLAQMKQFFEMMDNYESEEQINMLFSPKHYLKDEIIKKKSDQVTKNDVKSNDDDAYVETVSDDNSHSYSERSDYIPSPTDGKEHVGGFDLPIDHRKESLQDIYRRERLPEIQRILASGDQKAISNLIAELNADPFTVLPNKLKYSQLLAADVFFGFLTKMVFWFVMIALLLPIMVPGFTLLSLGAELLALWLIPDVENI